MYDVKCYRTGNVPKICIRFGVWRFIEPLQAKMKLP